MRASVFPVACTWPAFQVLVCLESVVLEISQSPRLPRIISLQVFRGLAALAVVIYHGALSTTNYVDAIPATAGAWFGKGFLGVDFFFVLSGFIIMYAHCRDEASVGSVRRYALKRLVRIFPAYLPVALAMMVLYAAVPSLSTTGGRDYSVVSSLLLVPADRAPVVVVAWSLVHELLFYFVFLLYYVSPRVFGFGLALWAIAIIAGDTGMERLDWLRYPLSPLNLEFMLGVLAAWAITTRQIAVSPRWLVTLGLAVSLMAVYFFDLSVIGFPRITFAAGLALVIVGCALYERVKAFAWAAPLVLLGNASYSIYLVHNQIFSLTQRVGKFAGFNWIGGMVLGVSVATLAGYLYHLAVEKRALVFFNNRLGKHQG